jgi:hypothetical protein
MIKPATTPIASSQNGRTLKRSRTLRHTRRREFIGLLGGAAAAWPLSVRAQQKSKVPIVGTLWHAGSAEEEALFLTQIQ